MNHRLNMMPASLVVDDELFHGILDWPIVEVLSILAYSTWRIKLLKSH